MPLKTITALCLAGFVSVGFAASGFAQADPALLQPDPAIAAMSIDQLVDARQTAMKEDGRLVKNGGGLTGADAVATAETLLKNFTNFPALFREGSINAKSEALPSVWEQWDTFTGLLTEAQGYAADALVAAQGGDTAGYQAALKSIGGLCGQCHQQFRAD